MADKGMAGGHDPQRGIEPGALSALLLELVGAPESAVGEAWERALRPGLVVGKFELVRELGRGGFGVVWEGRDRELGRSVAFKAVRAGRDVALREERLLREAEAAAALSHPNLVTLFDAGRGEHGPYLVMELLRGQTLERRLLQGPLAPGAAVEVALAVARGLAHAHAGGVVHRDVKPANVFLCRDGQVKVLDLGLAQAFGRRRVDGGTPGYMAPEQLEGAPEDERTDVFALGVLLFEMLTGDLPFPEERALRAAGPAPALDLPAAPALASVVGRMLSKRAVERPRDAGEVAAALEEVARGLEGGAPRGGGGVRTRRRPRWAALAAGGAVALAAATAFLLTRESIPGAGAEAVPSVAVLPFADLSPQKDQEYLADGVAEEILTALARVDGLRVVGRTSSFRFRGAEDLRAIGAQLSVGSLLEGTVRRSGDRIRVTAQLVNVADGFRTWSETYDRSVADVIAVQNEIAQAVVAGLRARLVRGATVVQASPRPANPEAYIQLLRGRHIARRGTAEDYVTAIEAYKRAIALAPDYAPAHAELSLAYSNWPTVQGIPMAPEDYATWVELARASAQRAIEVAPGLPDGYEARALFELSLFNWAAARADLEKARAIDPRSRLARGLMTFLLASFGRLEDAIALSLEVREEDPLQIFWALPSYYNAMGRFDLAREVLKRSLELEPRHPRSLRELGFTEILDGRPRAALELAERIPVDWMRWTVRALALHDLGREREGKAALEWLEQRGDGVAYQVAEVHAWRGEPDLAFVWLERALEAGDWGLRYLKYDPFLRSLRGDPRYAALLRRLGLPAD